MEGTATMGRRLALGDVGEAVQTFAQERGRLPSATTVDSLLIELRPYLKDPVAAKYALYDVDLTRFSTGEKWQRPFEMNNSLADKPIRPADEYREEAWVWYVRRPENSTSHTWGLIIDLNNAQVAWSGSEEDFRDPIPAPR
jgi:hypothetical protein